MKTYYYLESERKKAAERFESLDNVILVTQDSDRFDILRKTADDFEYRKCKLDFYDSRDLITSLGYPVIFCGIEPIIAEDLLVAPSDINEPQEVKYEPFFVEDKDSIFKVAVMIKEDELRDIIDEIFNRETEYKKGMHKSFFVPVSTFIQNRELFDTCQYPLIMNTYGDVKLPDGGYGVSSLFFALNSIYDDKDVINLSVEDLNLVYRATNDENRDITEKFLAALKVVPLHEYNKQQLSNMVDGLISFGKSEKLKMDSITHLRDTLQSAALNSEVFNKLGLDPKGSTKEKDAQKKHTM